MESKGNMDAAIYLYKAAIEMRNNGAFSKLFKVLIIMDDVAEIEKLVPIALRFDMYTTTQVLDYYVKKAASDPSFNNRVDSLAARLKNHGMSGVDDMLKKFKTNLNQQTAISKR